jgi:hypothetical protein
MEKKKMLKDDNGEVSASLLRETGRHPFRGRFAAAPSSGRKLIKSDPVFDRGN